MNKLKKYSLIGLASFLFSIVISAESAVSIKTSFDGQNSPIEFDSRLTGFMDFVKNLHKQGLLEGEVLIARGDQNILNLRSDGISPFDNSQDPQFMIGSVSKQFFAVALLKALYDSSSFETEELKISDVKKKLHAPISQFLPADSVIWSGNMPLWADEISLHHLLTHTSGVPNYTAAKEFSNFNPDDKNQLWYESYHSTSEIIALISKEKLLFAPGSEFSYSNTGYVIIAEAIESITSLPASQYLQETLFDRIGLSSTANPDQGRWDVLKDQPKFSGLAAPYKYDPRGDGLELYPLVHCEDISVAKGGGSIISTSADLLKWNQSLHKDQSVLPKELYNMLVTSNLDDYGYGIGIENNDTGVLLGHNGGIGSYRTLLLYMPESDLSIVILSNICSDFEKIEDEFYELYESLKDSIPDEKQRNEATFKIILEKYPNRKGFEIIAENISKLFS
jgi:CubicO group peptidase (beta-lactamase class C family)